MDLNKKKILFFRFLQAIAGKLRAAGTSRAQFTLPMDFSPKGCPKDWTPAMFFAADGRARPLAALLERGDDPNAMDSFGRTGVLLAAASGHSQCLELLLARGAAHSARVNGGWTAALYAAANGHLECLRLLIHAGASPDERDELGRSCAMMAAQSGHFECVDLLAATGADFEKEDYKSRRVADYLAMNAGGLAAQKLNDSEALWDSAASDEESFDKLTLILEEGLRGAHQTN